MLIKLIFISYNGHFQLCDSASKRIMGAAGVPLVPGYHGDEQDIDLMKIEADKIGYPILIKPTHGGGGKVLSFYLNYEFLISKIIILLLLQAKKSKFTF